MMTCTSLRFFKSRHALVIQSKNSNPTPPPQLKLDHNSIGSGLYPLMCFFNHACWFNCMGRPSQEYPGTYEVITVCDVKKGDALVINYLDHNHWFTTRSVLPSRIHLRQNQKILTTNSVKKSAV